jgi:hypothetical protein
MKILSWHFIKIATNLTKKKNTDTFNTQTGSGLNLCLVTLLCVERHDKENTKVSDRYQCNNFLTLTAIAS